MKLRKVLESMGTTVSLKLTQDGWQKMYSDPEFLELVANARRDTFGDSEMSVHDYNFYDSMYAKEAKSLIRKILARLGIEYDPNFLYIE